MATMQSMSPSSVMPASLSQFGAAPEHLAGQCIRFRRGDEAGDVALEEQLVAGWILEPEGDERAHVLLQRGAGVTWGS